jgi:hypothetical protein
MIQILLSFDTAHGERYCGILPMIFDDGREYLGDGYLPVDGILTALLGPWAARN